VLAVQKKNPIENSELKFCFKEESKSKIFENCWKLIHIIST